MIRKYPVFLLAVFISCDIGSTFNSEQMSVIASFRNPQKAESFAQSDKGWRITNGDQVVAADDPAPIRRDNSATKIFCDNSSTFVHD
jgi:hypothetical protein